MTALSPTRVIYIDEYVNMGLFRVIDWSPVLAILPHAGQEQSIYTSLHKYPALRFAAVDHACCFP